MAQWMTNGAGLTTRVVAFAAMVAVCFAHASNARAATDVRYGLTDDAWLLNGPGSLDDRLSTLDALGVRVVRFTLHWNQIATSEPAAPTDPSDPAYDWTKASQVLDGLRANGIEVVVQLLGTPGWANGKKPPNYIPRSSATFAAFATAAAREYPWITKWVIWNEPNQRIWLRPTSPTLYTVRLLNPAYIAIHGAIHDAEVAGGGTAPRGSTGGVSPVAWITGMHAAHARLDAYAQNPYPLDPKRETPLTGGCTHCTTITMATLGRLVTLVAHDWPRARIWLTEYGYQSNPPDKVLGVSPALQARYVSEGAYVAYHTPRVDLLIHFLYQDEPKLARFQSGLVTDKAVAKPALAAFELPLAETHRTGAETSLWGELRAPAAAHTTATLEERRGSTWHAFARIRPSSNGFYTWRGRLPRHTLIRVRAGPLAGASLTIV
ncbi:MAG TPA: hypothetical protein VFA97_00360 [Gaiellaceae bacterium]|nr:hypothetical protein [Gaiellaceae bacterium]